MIISKHDRLNVFRKTSIKYLLKLRNIASIQYSYSMADSVWFSRVNWRQTHPCKSAVWKHMLFRRGGYNWSKKRDCNYGYGLHIVTERTETLKCVRTSCKHRTCSLAQNWITRGFFMPYKSLNLFWHIKYVLPVFYLFLWRVWKELKSR